MRFLDRYGTGRGTVRPCQILQTMIQAIPTDVYAGITTRKVRVSFSLPRRMAAQHGR